jgi:hypothetical protein
MLQKLKSFIMPEPRENKPSEATHEQKHAYIKKIRQFIKERYQNKSWVEQQTFKTEPIDIGSVGSVFKLKGNKAIDIYEIVSSELNSVRKIYTEFEKYFKIREAKHVEIYEKLQALEHKFDMNKEGKLISDTPEFKKILKEYNELPFPFAQMRMEQYRFHSIELVPVEHSYRVKPISQKITSHKVTPLTANEVLKFGTLLERILTTPIFEVAVPYDAPSDQNWDNDFKLGDELREKDKVFASLATHLAWDYDINEDREFFDGVLAHRKEGWASRGGLDAHIYDMAFAVEKVITMSIKQ